MIETIAFRALTTTVEIAFPTDLPSATLLRALIARYPASDAEPTVRYRLAPHELIRDGVARPIEDPSDVVPVFELDLYEQVIATARPGWLLHASAIDTPSGAVVFAGPSGAGKTTLALTLVREGRQLLTEEIVWISDGQCCGLSRPLHVVDNDLDLPESWTRVDYPMRGSSAVRQLAVPPRDVYLTALRPVRALVLLTHGPDRAVGLARLSPSEALLRFWDSTLRIDDPALRTATELLRDVPAYRLATRTFQEAYGFVMQLV